MRIHEVSFGVLIQGAVVGAMLCIGCAVQRDAVVEPTGALSAIVEDGGVDACGPQDFMDSCKAGEEYSFVERICKPLELGQQPGDPCGPAGEGKIPYAACDARRGLQCKAAPPGEIDAPPTCACEAGQSWSLVDRRCTGTRLGERPGDPCGPGGEGAIPYASCNQRRGLVCAPPPAGLIDAPPTCECPGDATWSDALLSCVTDAGCRP